MFNNERKKTVSAISNNISKIENIISVDLILVDIELNRRSHVFLYSMINIYLKYVELYEKRSRLLSQIYDN